jgi:hypothetical protein
MIKFTCPFCSDEMEAANSLSNKQTQCANCGRYMNVPNVEEEPPLSSPSPHIVNYDVRDGKCIITDVRIPFGRMVAIIVKWTLAAIPAAIIIGIIYLIVWLLILAGTGLLMGIGR